MIPAEIMSHILELRRRLLYYCIVLLGAWGICYNYADYILGWLTLPLARNLSSFGLPPVLIYTGLAEAFLTYIHLSFVCGFILSWPALVWHIWRYCAPGLYRSERLFLSFVLFGSSFFFLLGASFVYWVVVPVAWRFFTEFATRPLLSNLSINLLPKMDEYFSFMLKLTLVFGMCFQLPIILVLLTRLGVVSSTSLARFRRYAVVIIFIVAAVVTPPDVFSQLALALPLMLLYELGVLGSKVLK